MNNLEKAKQMSEYRESLKKLDAEALRKLEQEIIEEAEKADEEISKLEFDTPKENYFEVAEAIRMMLNKKTVEWRFTLGLVAMYDFWNPAERKSKINYPMLDSTLRTLGELQFTGYNEWAAVVAVNKYFESLRNEYVDATEKIYDIASKHDAIISELKLKDADFANEVKNDGI